MGHDADLVLSHDELDQFTRLGGFQKLSDMMQQEGFQFLKPGDKEPVEVVTGVVVKMLQAYGGSLTTTNYDDSSSWMEAVESEMSRRIIPATVFDYIHTTQHGEKLRKVCFGDVREAICRVFTKDVKWTVASTLADHYRQEDRQTLMLAGSSSSQSKHYNKKATAAK